MLVSGEICCSFFLFFLIYSLLLFDLSFVSFLPASIYPNAARAEIRAKWSSSCCCFYWCCCSSFTSWFIRFMKFDERLERCSNDENFVQNFFVVVFKFLLILNTDLDPITISDRINRPAFIRKSSASCFHIFVLFIDRATHFQSLDDRRIEH